jgi:hypothetical protein
MQAERVRSVRRPRGEHPGERDVRIAARMHLEHVAIGEVKPGDHDDLVARGQPAQRSLEPRIDVDPRVGRSLGTLPRCLIQRAQRRPDVPDRLERVWFPDHGEPLAVLCIWRVYLAPPPLLASLGAQTGEDPLPAGRAVRAPPPLLASLGMRLLALATVGLVRAWYSPPHLDVPPPFWMVVVPTLDFAAAACAMAAALTLALALMRRDTMRISI